MSPDISTSLIGRIHNVFSDGIHFAQPISSLRMNEIDLVRAALQMLQGLSSSVFYWDQIENCFRAKNGIYVTHLSHTSLHVILNKFIYAATCLQLVNISVHKVEKSVKLSSPTLNAFASSVSALLKRLRDIALKEEVTTRDSCSGITSTLLGLSSSLSGLCSGAEYLFQIVHGAISEEYFDAHSSVLASEMAVHVLDHLYKKLDDVCLVQGGEEEAYQMLLHIFTGSLLPYIESLDSWLFEGTLDDPFEEMFFYNNKAISIDEAEFWDKSYLLRHSPLSFANDHVRLTKEKKELGEKEPNPLSSSVNKDQENKDLHVCPLFIMEIAKSIVSAGKSLQLIRHVPMAASAAFEKGNEYQVDNYRSSNDRCDTQNTHFEQGAAGLTLSEVFCVSLAGLVGHGDHVSRYLWQNNQRKYEIYPSIKSDMNKLSEEKGNAESFPSLIHSNKIWYKFFEDTLFPRRVFEFSQKYASNLPDRKEDDVSEDAMDEFYLRRSFCPENPVITVCKQFLNKSRDALKILNLSRNLSLPALNDEVLRKAIFSGESVPSFSAGGTSYSLGFQFDKSKYFRLQDDTKLLELLFYLPTILPKFQDDLQMSELLPFQKNSTLPSRVLSWMLGVEPRTTPLPLVIVQECLIVYIKKQVDYIGSHVLSKLMKDWRLMTELGVLRAIYLLGSGDLLQHFLTVIFDKLDKGETWDDEFELNTILQESIRNSADGALLTAPDSLVVSISTTHGHNGGEQNNASPLASTLHKGRMHSLGNDGLDLLKFTYKVPWPLELIANMEAIKKYNQVMGFLLKVKRAKFVLDKARRLMWKGRGNARNSQKHHWLVEQKLLHFVDAFHQYVMDRVYHSAWRELCEGMSAAGSLDEVIEVHEAYLLSIQRQCFVVPDKLWALIASRINSILGLALDFYTIQQTLSSSGTITGIKTRCETEVNRIEKQFDDCIAFLLRVLSFKLNVGHFPHLADLVTRINYNYYYMSDNGNLITATSSESVTSRLGK